MRQQYRDAPTIRAAVEREFATISAVVSASVLTRSLDVGDFMSLSLEGCCVSLRALAAEAERVASRSGGENSPLRKAQVRS